MLDFGLYILVVQLLDKVIDLYNSIALQLKSIL